MIKLILIICCRQGGTISGMETDPSHTMELSNKTGNNSGMAIVYVKEVLVWFTTRPKYPSTVISSPVLINSVA